MAIKRVAFLTSGGDAPGMNAAIRAVVRSGLILGMEMFGVYEGYKGLVEGKIEQFTSKNVSHILDRGGTIIGSARLPEFTEKVVRDLAVKQLKKYFIDALIVIGGDGTFKGGQKLSEMGIKVIGIPATIDNDVNSTDSTIGFSTALNTVVDAIDKLRDTSESHHRCSILETMGRDCGDLAIYAGVCGGAEYVITKETGFDKKAMLDSLRKKKLKGRRHAIILTTENAVDVHKLAKEIEDYSGYETRATVLGYVQRGGKPTPEDRVLASRFGNYAIELLQQDISGVIVGISHNDMIHMTFDESIKCPFVKSQLFDLIEKIR